MSEIISGGLGMHGKVQQIEKLGFKGLSMNRRRGQSPGGQTECVNPFNASCSKLLLFEGFSAILV